MDIQHPYLHDVLVLFAVIPFEITIMLVNGKALNYTLEQNSSCKTARTKNQGNNHRDDSPFAVLYSAVRTANETESVRVSTGRIRPSIYWWNPSEYLLVESVRVSTGRIRPSIYWSTKPNPSEYLLVESVRVSTGRIRHSLYWSTKWLVGASILLSLSGSSRIQRRRLADPLSVASEAE